MTFNGKLTGHAPGAASILSKANAIAVLAANVPQGGGVAISGTTKADVGDVDDGSGGVINDALTFSNMNDVGETITSITIIPFTSIANNNGGGALI
jgi:hypothetical protein